MEAPFEAILFDFDGVLVDSEPIHFACWRQVLTPLSINLEWDHYHQHFIGVSDRKMAEALVGLASCPRTVEEVYALYPSKTALFEKQMRARLPFSSGVIDFITGLAGYRLGVVSSSRRTEVEPVLAAGGILSCFEVAVFGEDVTRHKPDPEPYLKAANMLQTTRILVVEDSEAGEHSGRAAGFEVLRIPEPGLTVDLVKRRLNGHSQ
ncbi:MAG TPA: HAD family phosphatase [Bryobacteraceae bacterium]|nr:HAD family phosphatase [Bryobacteraceae bacterium]